MKYYEATSTIAAPPETVWAILTDAPAYSDWESGVVRLEGNVAPGEKLKVTPRPEMAGAVNDGT